MQASISAIFACAHLFQYESGVALFINHAVVFHIDHLLDKFDNNTKRPVRFPCWGFIPALLHFHCWSFHFFYGSNIDIVPDDIQGLLIAIRLDHPFTHFPGLLSLSVFAKSI